MNSVKMKILSNARRTGKTYSLQLLYKKYLIEQQKLERINKIKEILK